MRALCSKSFREMKFKVDFGSPEDFSCWSSGIRNQPDPIRNIGPDGPNMGRGPRPEKLVVLIVGSATCNNVRTRSHIFKACHHDFVENEHFHVARISFWSLNMSPIELLEA
jgi:hypothetical protein